LYYVGALSSSDFVFASARHGGLDGIGHPVGDVSARIFPVQASSSAFSYRIDDPSDVFDALFPLLSSIPLRFQPSFRFCSYDYLCWQSQSSKQLPDYSGEGLTNQT
jgi:hypothetical protein